MTYRQELRRWARIYLPFTVLVVILLVREWPDPVMCLIAGFQFSLALATFPIGGKK